MNAGAIERARIRAQLAELYAARARAKRAGTNAQAFGFALAASRPIGSRSSQKR